MGDRVFGLRNGAHAEYVCVREERLVAHMPAGMTFEEATAVCDGFTQGLACLKAADVGEGTRLLVYGASGSCGTAAVQLGKHHLGAHVTAVCNTKNVELVRSLGVDEVIDYLEDDFTKQGRTYDVVVDAVGKHSYFRSRRALASHGYFVATDRLYNFPLAFLTRIAKKKVVFNVERPTRENILHAKELLEAGKYRPVIDRTYPLEDVIEATRYVETFQKVGNVVLDGRQLLERRRHGLVERQLAALGIAAVEVRAGHLPHPSLGLCAMAQPAPERRGDLLIFDHRPEPPGSLAVASLGGDASPGCRRRRCGSDGRGAHWRWRAPRGHTRRPRPPGRR